MTSASADITASGSNADPDLGWAIREALRETAAPFSVQDRADERSVHAACPFELIPAIFVHDFTGFIAVRAVPMHPHYRNHDARPQ